MNVLSLFDGISCGQIALNRANIKYDTYFASEIDKAAMKITQSNYPNTIQLGSVLDIQAKNLPKINLLLGGSPCQNFSKAGNQEGFKGKSGLFYEFARVLRETNPDFFLLENVPMKKEFENEITSILGFDPIRIDSALFSAQRRVRLYWTNIKVIKPIEDRKVLIRDILDTENKQNYEFVHSDALTTAKYKKNYIQYDLTGKGYNSQNFRAYYLNGKMCTLGSSTPHVAKILLENGKIRKTTRLEHERLQTLPEGYTKAITVNKAKSAIGNGWTADVISYILSRIKI